MKVIICKDAKEVGACAAAIFAEVMNSRPTTVLGLATGTSPLPLYAKLVEANQAGEIDFSTTITFNLDEYVGLDPDHEQSYRHFMNQNLFDQVNINKKNTHVPNGIADDPDLACMEYEAMMGDVGGVDLQLLGIGSNGHIGFSEPGTSLASRTHVADLTESTIKDNSRLFDNADDVPRQAISMGIGTVLDAEKVVLIANGENKADAIAAALEGPVTCMCPASALQMHPDVTWVIAEDATGGLRHFGK